MLLVNILNFRCFKCYLCVTCWLLFREFPIVTFGAPFRYSKVKDISLYYRRNTILSQAHFTSEPRTGQHSHDECSASTPQAQYFCCEYILCEAAQLTCIEFRISVLISIFIDSYAAFQYVLSQLQLAIPLYTPCTYSVVCRGRSAPRCI